MNIEALAKKAGFTVTNGSYGLKFSGGDLEMFARLVTDAEREACAKVCDQHAENMARHGDTALAEQSRQDAVAIRKRSNVLADRPAAPLAAGPATKGSEVERRVGRPEIKP